MVEFMLDGKYGNLYILFVYIHLLKLLICKNALSTVNISSIIPCILYFLKIKFKEEIGMSVFVNNYYV